LTPQIPEDEEEGVYLGGTGVKNSSSSRSISSSDFRAAARSAGGGSQDETSERVCERWREMRAWWASVVDVDVGMLI